MSVTAIKTVQSLLIVDDEDNIVSALKRLLRRDGYQILTANSGEEGLAMLSRHRAGVVISDQRMPGMSGVEFLSKVKKHYPDTVRIMLSGYTELNTVTDSVNKGEIYKYVTKPWDDDQLRANVRKAFREYGLTQANERRTSELHTLNEALVRTNESLERDVAAKSREAELNVEVLQVSQGILENLPVAVLGVDGDGVIACANRMAHELFAVEGATLLGVAAHDVLPTEVLQMMTECAGSGAMRRRRIAVPAHGELLVSGLKVDTAVSSNSFIVVLS